MLEEGNQRILKIMDFLCAYMTSTSFEESMVQYYALTSAPTFMRVESHKNYYK